MISNLTTQFSTAQENEIALTYLTSHHDSENYWLNCNHHLQLSLEALT